MDRLAMLEQMVAARPLEAFPLYGLAMEHRRRGDLDAAATCFETLLARHADYVPGYLMAAQCFVARGNRARAREIVTLGITAAQRMRDDHARSELEGMAMELQEESGG